MTSSLNFYKKILLWTCFVIIPQCCDVAYELFIPASLHSAAGKDVVILLLAQGVPLAWCHLQQLCGRLQLGGAVWRCKAVVWAYSLATVATIETVSHLFTDVFGQFAAVLDCQV